jgi:urease accessory protein
MRGADAAPQVDLRFERRAGGTTFMARQYAGYPFHVGRVLRRADAPPTAATVLLQSCSGGLFEHDRVALQLKACRGAGARVGNAAATVVHSMTGGEAVSTVRLEAEPGAWLEYQPALAILFPQARLLSRIDVVLHPGALVMLADSFLGHDPQGQARPFDVLDTCLTVRDETQRLLVRDRVRVDGALWDSAAAGVSASFIAQGSLFVLSRDADVAALVDALRVALAGLPGVYAGAGALPNQCGALVRVLAASGEAVRQALLAATEAMRHAFGLGAGGAQREARLDGSHA